MRSPPLVRLPQLVELPASMSGMEALRELVAQSNCFPRIPEARAGPRREAGCACMHGQLAVAARMAGRSRAPRPPALSSVLPPPEQVLGTLGALRVADLSFNIYMEACVSLDPLFEGVGLSNLQRLDLRKMLGAWKDSSIQWLARLQERLCDEHVARGGSPADSPEVLWD